MEGGSKGKRGDLSRPSVCVCTEGGVKVADAGEEEWRGWSKRWSEGWSEEGRGEGRGRE